MLSFPRGLRKIIADFKTADILRYYKDKYKEEALSVEQVHDIWKTFFPEIIKYMIFNNYEYLLPAHLGSFRIRKKKVEPQINEEGELSVGKLSVDYKKTKKLWEEKYPGKTGVELKAIPDKPLVRELNEHTDGYRCSWYWDKMTCNVRNQSAYILTMTRTNKQLLSRAITTNDLEFYE